MRIACCLYKVLDNSNVKFDLEMLSQHQALSTVDNLFDTREKPGYETERQEMNMVDVLSDS